MKTWQKFACGKNTLDHLSRVYLLLDKPVGISRCFKNRMFLMLGAIQSVLRPWRSSQKCPEILRFSEKAHDEVYCCQKYKMWNVPESSLRIQSFTVTDKIQEDSKQCWSTHWKRGTWDLSSFVAQNLVLLQCKKLPDPCKMPYLGRKEIPTKQGLVKLKQNPLLHFLYLQPPE